ncbi:MAG: hypothetical protein IKM99_03000 [Bacteroidales bacterium]|nr:hypothetical protein [Bacteroidales bacterium]
MNSKLKSILINIVLFAVVVFLAIKVIQSIKAPIDFGNEKSTREAQVVQRLKDIRDAEIQYKQANSKYTSDFDSLINFCSNYEIPIVKMVPDPNDTTFTKSINDTIGYVKVLDSLFGKRPNFNIRDLSIVPFSDPTTTFEIHDSIIKRGGISVPVFEVKTPYEVYLATPGEKFSEKEWNTRVQNIKAEMEQIDKYAGLKVGSLEEASTDGNWEKL